MNFSFYLEGAGVAQRAERERKGPNESCMECLQIKLIRSRALPGNLLPFHFCQGDISSNLSG